MSKLDSRRLGLIGLVASLGLYAAAQATVLIVSNFYAGLNDFWPLKQFAERFHWTNPGALQDGFFPYLYPLLLKFIPDGAALPIAATLSLISACTILAFIYLIARRVVGPGWALVAVWVVGVQPEFFFHATIAGADMISVVPVVIGIWVLMRVIDRNLTATQLTRALFLSGLLFGFAGTLRYHVLLLAVIPIALALQLRDSRWRNAGLALLGVVVGYLPQMVVNLAAGQSPLFTLQGFNVYRQVVGVDWNTTGSLDPASYVSAVSVLRSHPIEFATSYLASLANFTFPLAVIAVAVVCAIGTRWHHLMRALLIGAVFFSLATAFAFSDRALIAFVPILGLAGAVIVGAVAGWLPRLDSSKDLFASVSVRVSLAIAVALVLMWATFGWIQTDIANSFARSQLELERAGYEQLLLDKVQVDSMDEVFTNDFSFYASSIPGGVPMYNGGWVQISQKGTEMAQELDGSSVDAFLCSAAKAGVKAVIWNPGSTSGFAADLSAILAGDATNPSVSTTSGQGLIVSSLRFTEDLCS